MTSLRFRIPARPVARALCSAPPPQNSSHISPLPELEFLDLSSSGILENEIDLLLVRLPLLKHIVLDGCNIFRGDQSPSDWRALGKRCALIGVQRAREREKVLKEYLELRDASLLMGDISIAGGAINEGRKIKPGRRGLATATISFRAPEPVASASALRPTLPPIAIQKAVHPPVPERSPTTTPQGSSLPPQKTKKDRTDNTSETSPPKVAASNSIPSLVSATLQDIQSHYNKRNTKKKSAVPVVPASTGPRVSSVAVFAESSLPSNPASPPQFVGASQDVQTISEKKLPIKGKGIVEGKARTSKVKPAALNKSNKIRVLPALPSLVSLSVTLPSTVEVGTYSLVRSQFEEGWAEGVTQLEGVRARLRTSAGNGIRVMSLGSGPQSRKGDSSDSEAGSDRNSTGGSEASARRPRAKDGLEGLVDVDRTDPDAFGTYKEGSVSLLSPILCFAGPSRDGQHVDNCGHSVAWKVMKDDM